MKRLVRLFLVAATITGGLVTAVSTQGTQAQVLSAASPPEEGRARCNADGEVRFICGLENPEDLAKVPSSPWVIVSAWQADGHLSAVPTRKGRTLEIYPGEDPQARQDTERYADCPGPMPENFWAHGLSLLPGDDEVHTLFVVRHGGREAIEVFELDGREATPSVTWIGCVLPPEGAPAQDFNSVVWLPDGGLAATRFAVDEVSEWHPGSGWSVVPGSQGISPNGLEVSPDGRYFYIGGWGTETLYRLSREAPYQRDELWVGFHVDNVHLDDDGRLLLAGQDATTQAVLDCIFNADGTYTTDNSRCRNIISRVLSVDQDLQNDEEIFRYRTNDNLALGTAAIQVDDRIWIGGLRGERVAVIDDPR